MRKKSLQTALLITLISGISISCGYKKALEIRFMCRARQLVAEWRLLFTQIRIDQRLMII